MEMMFMLLNEDEKNKILNELYSFIDNNCIFRCNPEVNYNEIYEIGHIPPKYPSSEKLTWQFFLRRLTHDYKMLNYVCALFFDDLFKKIKLNEQDEYFQLCGLETSSIPLLIAMQMYASRYKIGINTFSIRKQRKSYGLFNFIDGIPSKAPVIIVDDLINSGQSIARCLDVCKYELQLGPSNNIYSIIKFDDNMDQVKFDDKIINVTSIFSKSQFDYTFQPEKYWLPKDCDRTINNRSDYF